jgi:hypothetical protein
MAASHEAADSIKERARRALLDNPAPPPAGTVAERLEGEAAPLAAGPLDADSQRYAEWIELRLRALETVRELEPRRACCARQVRDLTRTLIDLAGDSIHFRPVLERLREAHAEWQSLEERLWAARHIIQSTQWLVELLTAPPQRAE